MKKESTLTKYWIWFAAIAGFLYSFEALWGNAARPICAAIGWISVVCALYCIMTGRLLRRWDTWLFAAFLLMTCVSAFAGYGLTPRYFTSIPFCVWLFLAAMYFLMRTTSEPELLLRRFAVMSLLGFSLVNLSVLVFATASLFSRIPGENMLTGCFYQGRLYGLTNANVMSFSSAALLFLSIFCSLDSDSGKRWPYALSALLGWMTLGLTNCRTSILGVSLAIGLLVFAAVWRHKPGVVGFLAALIAGIAVGILASVSFYLPLYIYRGILHTAAMATGNHVLEKNLASLTARFFTEDNGTLTSRTLIWSKVFHDLADSPRNTLLGISSISEGRITNIDPLKPEFQVTHAHNSYLELLRRFGVPGFLFCMALVVIWCIRGAKLFFHPRKKLSVVFLMAAAVGMLVMGLTEQVPFPYLKACSLSPIFFLICGCAMRSSEK